MKLTQINETIYLLTDSDKTGDTEIILFHLFPGIYLQINNVNMKNITCAPTQSNYTDFLRINYCFEGRCEVKLKDCRYVYVDNSVLCIEDYPPQNAFYYPLGFYRGIEISIDKNIISKESYEALDIFGVAPSKLVDTFGNTENFFLQIASDVFHQKATEIISIWENRTLSQEAKIYQLRLILCQIFFYLLNGQATNRERTYNASILSHGQSLIALDCEKKITKDLSQKRTISSLAEDYKISPSSLKKFFAQVYGCSISEYLQNARMKEASQLLINENLSIMQIAALVGYENQSKFSAVFKKHTGYAPLEYKRIYNLQRKEEKI